LGGSLGSWSGTSSDGEASGEVWGKEEDEGAGEGERARFFLGAGLLLCFFLGAGLPLTLRLAV
jgi:hypothetical protein